MRDLTGGFFAYSQKIVGTLSEDDDDGSENVAKKMNFSSFKLNRVYLDPLKCHVQATFPGVEFLRILFRFKKRKENFFVVCSRPP